MTIYGMFYVHQNVVSWTAFSSIYIVTLSFVKRPIWSAFSNSKSAKHKKIGTFSYDWTQARPLKMT